MNELMEYARQEKEMIDRLAGTLAGGEELAKSDSFLACRCLRDYLEIAEGLETTPGVVNCLAQQLYAEFVKRYLSQVAGFLSALKRTGAFNAEAKEALAWLAATGMPLFEEARKAVACVREVGQLAVLVRVLDYYDGMLDMTGEALAALDTAETSVRPDALAYDLIYDIPSCVREIPSLLADIRPEVKK